MDSFCYSAPLQVLILNIRLISLATMIRDLHIPGMEPNYFPHNSMIMIFIVDIIDQTKVGLFRSDDTAYLWFWVLHM